MRLFIRLFAAHREIAGRSAFEIEMPDGSRVADAWARACVEHPALASAARSPAFAVNRVHADADAPVADGDEIAILPPVAGG